MCTEPVPITSLSLRMCMAQGGHVTVRSMSGKLDTPLCQWDTDSCAINIRQGHGKPTEAGLILSNIAPKGHPCYFRCWCFMGNDVTLYRSRWGGGADCVCVVWCVLGEGVFQAIS